MEAWKLETVNKDRGSDSYVLIVSSENIPLKISVNN